jgi:FKBP-type peptidyl-prolyl cis-trans isomerase
MKLRFLSFFVAGSIILLSSCNRDNDVFDAFAQFEKEVREIDAFLDVNHPGYIKDPSGVRIVIKTLGTGLPPQQLSNVNVDYIGSLFSNGTVFEEGNASGPLGNYINGWRAAFAILPEGTEATIYIPSYHAYGNTGSAKIPASSTLIFEVKLNDVTQTPVYNQRFHNDTTLISAYIEDNSITATKNPNGVWYTITQVGPGQTPGWYNQVKHTYSFRLISNPDVVVATFDREPTETFTSRVVDYIPGVAIVLQQLQAGGGKARIYVPSGLGFGINNVGDPTTGQVAIPANSNIIVDIELKEVL